MWVEKRIVLVNQLFNPNVQLMSYSEFLNTYKFPATPKEYAILFDAIPTSIIMLFKGIQPCISSVSLPNPLDSHIGRIYLTNHSKSNKNIRALFQTESPTIPHVVSYWNSFVSDINWKRAWTIPNKYLVTNKVKEVSFKMLHKFYPANHYVTKFKRDINVNCGFCGSQPETVQHLFWICSYTRTFWKDFSRFIAGHLYKDFTVKWDNVVFCFFRRQKERCLLYYKLFILAKFYFHKCKYSNQKPNFKHYYNDVLCYIKLICG